MSAIWSNVEHEGSDVATQLKLNCHKLCITFEHV
jgi:hypothetical protein